MKKLVFVCALATLSLLVLPLATPAQQVDDVYCEDDSHCGCAGGCQPGGWCMCGDLEQTADLAPETPELDLEAILDDNRIAATGCYDTEECRRYCQLNQSFAPYVCVEGQCYCG